MIVSDVAPMPGQGAISQDNANTAATQIELMKSKEIVNGAKNRVAILFPELIPVGVKLSIGMGSSIYTLSATGDEPRYTQAFLNALMDEYLEYRKKTRSKLTESSLSVITDQLGNVEKELRSAEDDLKRFLRENNIVFLQEQGSSAGSYLGNLNNQLATQRTELQFLEKMTVEQTMERERQHGRGMVIQKTAEDTNTEQEKEEKNEASEYFEMRQRIDMIKGDRSELARFLKPKHPRMIRLDEEIQRLERTFDLYRNQSMQQMAARREALRVQIKHLESEVKEWEVKAHDLSSRMADYNRIKDQVSRQKELYNRLLSTIQNLDINKSLAPETMSIFERASEAGEIRPISTNKILASLGIGFALGVGILFLLDRLNDRISSLTELCEFFNEPVIGQVPHEPTLADAALEKSLLKTEDKRHIYSESYRNIRSSLLYMDIQGERPKTILITSASPNEGKSTLSANIAVTFSLMNSKVLLIDSDLRHGLNHQFFGLSSTPGLADVLGQRMTFEMAIRKVPEYANLTILTRGKLADHPGELFLGPQTDNLIKQIYDQYDYIIIDSAPVLVADDTPSLAPKIDGVLFVVRAGNTSTRLARNAIDILSSRQVNILGLILNDLDSTLPEYYYYKYKEYYHTTPKTSKDDD